tara:strand:- start:71 stop:451 length:381 start_codon:yes stop_codon:yes gene_type:complete
MATYNAESLSGAGTPIEALTAGVSYVFALSSSTPIATDNNSASAAYFTMEQAGSPFDGSAPTNAVGTYSSFDWDFANLITSSYIASVVVDTRNTSSGTFQFTPSADIAVSSSFLRATGNLSLSITV